MVLVHNNNSVWTISAEYQQATFLAVKLWPFSVDSDRWWTIVGLGMICSGFGDIPEILLAQTLFYTWPEGAGAVLSVHSDFICPVSKKNSSLFSHP